MLGAGRKNALLVELRVSWKRYVERQCVGKRRYHAPNRRVSQEEKEEEEKKEATSEKERSASRQLFRDVFVDLQHVISCRLGSLRAAAAASSQWASFSTILLFT